MAFDTKITATNSSKVDLNPRQRINSLHRQSIKKSQNHKTFVLRKEEVVANQHNAVYIYAVPILKYSDVLVAQTSLS